MSSMWQTLRRAVSQQQAAAQASPGGGAPQPLAAAAPSPADSPPPAAAPQPSAPPAPAAPGPPAQQAAPATPAQHGPGASEHPVQRSISMPAPSRARDAPARAPAASLGDAGHARPRPPYGRSMSRTEVVKKYIKRETAVFFGVEESCAREQQERWLNRRRRLAARTCGALRDDQQPPRSPSTPRTPTSAYATQQPRDPCRPDVLPPGGRDSADALPAPRWSEPPVRRKESVAQMTFGGLALVVTTLTRHRPRPQPRSNERARSFALSDVPESASGDEDTPMTLGEDEVFFDKPLPQAAVAAAAAQAAEGDVAGPSRVVQAEGGFVASRDQLDHVQLDAQYYTRERAPSWRRTPERMETASESGPEVGCSRIWTRVLDRVFDNSDRRTYGMGVMGKFFGRSIKKRVAARQDIKEQLEDMEDYRPFFTYWVTTVQVLILIISLVCYGLGPVGFNLNHRSGQVLVTSLSLQQVDYQEPANFWIGPRAADLIHLGAKFAPCMRKDVKIIKEIEKGREKERETACCIRNDDSGCVQSSQADCSKTISTWKKWSPGEAGPGGRISGSVCGLDPKFCEAPASVAPYEWPDDITKWPICRKTNSRTQQRTPYKDKIAEHMVCEVIGHPCCIGIHGMCRITTKEYCDFVRGYFHEEASLCSQVSCLDDVCGMIPFYSPEIPDQFYRLWTSLFLHAGIFQLAITLMIQYFLMRDLEKLTGSLRIMIIYMGSGVAGNLASAIFVPYRADVGPAGAQFGLLACLIVEVLNAWMMLKQPEQALLKLVGITLLLFLVGVLPWVDNYSHLFGFVFGFLLSYALMPFLSFGEYDRRKKVALVWVCLLSALFLFAALVVLFYVVPVYDCEVCGYFNCVPLTRDFCASQNINFMREEPVV